MAHHNPDTRLGTSQPSCPLCQHTDVTPFFYRHDRQFWQCVICHLVFVSRSDYPDRHSEKARYDQHRNDPGDPGYQAFLNRLATPLLARVSSGTHGLDFGCGPGPALAQILRRAGLKVDLYDAFYAHDEKVWSRQYDFITATEVIEHLHRPDDEFERLFAALRPGGWLGIMTKWVSSITSFEHSRYTRDPTHVCLYSRETLAWVANRWEVEVEFPSLDISLFRVT